MDQDNILYAEWDNGHSAYRLYHASEPQETVSYAKNILEAEQIAQKRNEGFSLAFTGIQVEEKPKHRLYVDMDGTLAEFKIVSYQEQLFEKGYFANLKPHECVVDAIKDIISNNSNIEVFVLSAYLTDSEYALNEKNEWLDRYIPEIKSDHRVFVPCGTDKKEAIQNLTTNDFLLDDYTVNLLDWVPPGKAIKLINNINHTHGTWKEDCIRYDRPSEDISGLICDVISGNTHAYDTKYGYDKNHPVISPECISSIGLASMLDDFFYTFDTYNYKDNVEDREENIFNIETQILAEGTKSFKESILKIFEEKESLSDDIVSIGVECLKEINKYEFFNNAYYRSLEERPDKSFMNEAINGMSEIGFALTYVEGFSADGLLFFKNLKTGEKEGFDGFEMVLNFVNDQKKDLYVETNRGIIPLNDYFDITAIQNGFDDYNDLKAHGLSIKMPKTVTNKEEKVEHGVSVGDVYEGTMGYEVVTSVQPDNNQVGVQIFSDSDLTKVAGGGSRFLSDFKPNKYIGRVEDIRGDREIEYPNNYDIESLKDVWEGIAEDDFETSASDYERHTEEAFHRKTTKR